MTITRRRFPGLLVALGAILTAATPTSLIPAAAQEAVPKEFRVGYQEIGLIVVARQQATADRFHRLGLIPRAITIRDAVWAPPRT